MVVRVDARVDFCAPRGGLLARVEGVGVQDAGEFDLELDRAVLVEDPVDAVLVVGGGEDVADQELACAGYGCGVVAEIGVFEEDAGILCGGLVVVLL